MKPDLHGAVFDCEKIRNPHDRAQVQTVLLSIAEDCSGCEHFKAVSSCICCSHGIKVEEVKSRILELIGHQAS